MKKTIAAVIAAALIAGTSPVLAGGGYGHGYGGHGYKYGGYGYKHGGYRYGGHKYGGYGYGGHRGHDYGDEILIGAGIVGVSVLLGSMLSRPYYYQPTPAYYQPAPTCYQDEVWRCLPDGRIQTGVRTRCY